MPSIASVSSQAISGFSGLPKLRQSVRASGLPAGARDVARRLEHGERAAGLRVERGDPPRAVQGDREPAVRGAQPQHGRVEPGAANRSRADEVVVAAVDRDAALQARRAEEVDELGWLGLDRPVGDRRLQRPRPRRDAVARRLLREELGRDLADDLVVPEHAQRAGGR